MTFRDYRPRGTARIAEITEEAILLRPHHAAPDATPQPYGKGDYAERLETGELVGWKKADLEAAYAPVRNRQASPARGRASRRKAADKTTPPIAPGNGQATQTASS